MSPTKIATSPRNTTAAKAENQINGMYRCSSQYALAKSTENKIYKNHVEYIIK